MDTSMGGAGPVVRFGRTEQTSYGTVWALYEALERDDWRGGQVVAWFVRHADAVAFMQGLNPPRATEADSLREENARLRQRVEELERAPRCCADTIPPGCRTCRCADAAEAKLARCVEAASDVAEGACSFKDSRVSYEEWQINVGSMERLRAAIAGEATPRGWLIESTLSHGGGPRWWQGKQPGTEEQWTGSHTAAIRFARREDAEACRLTLGDAHVSKVTEHVWL